MKWPMPTGDEFIRQCEHIREGRKPQPYPVGKTHGYPTRLMWIVGRIQDGKQSRKAYFGKPSRTAFQEFLYYARNRQVTMWTIAELDKGGLVIYGQGFEPLQAINDVVFATDWNQTIYRYYHPWSAANPYVGCTFQDFCRKRIKIGDKVHVVYGAKKGQVLKQKEVQEFKTWYEMQFEGKIEKPKAVQAETAGARVANQIDQVLGNAGIQYQQFYYDNNGNLFRRNG